MKIAIKRRVILPVAAILLAVGGAATYSLSNNSAEPTNTKQSGSQLAAKTVDEPVVEQVETTAIEQTTQPITQVEQPTTPEPAATPEQNKAKIMAVITEYVNKNWPGVSAEYEKSCFDRLYFARNDMYGNYDSLANFPLLMRHQAGELRFMDMSCRVSAPAN